MNSFVVDILDLPTQAGATKEAHCEVPAPDDFGTEVIAVPSGTTIVLDAILTNLDDGVLASGRTHLPLRGQCVRCLTDIDDEQDISFDEMFFTPEAIEKQKEDGDEDADELFVLGDTSIDLEQPLRDALVLGLPFQPLCSPDCPGLCPDCGERLADLPEDHHHEQLDPRWSALGALLNEAESAQGTDDAETAR